MKRRIRALLATVALTVASVLGVAIMSTATADAATGASFCFRWASGQPYASQPVQLYSYYSGQLLRNGRTNASGCGTFTNLTSTGQYRVRAYDPLVTPYGTQIYDGWTPYFTGPGAGTANLGMGTMYYVGCLPNQYGSCR